MFQFIGCFLPVSRTGWQDVTLAGLPHSEIHESLLTCSSSWLIAAYRVLLRFETPRHPPYALTNLTYVNGIRYFRFILICLGKSFSVENIVYMSSQYLPCLDFLVSSVQFSVNNKSFINHPINHGFPVDAIRDYQSSNRLWNFSRCALKTRQCKTFNQMTDLRLWTVVHLNP